MVGNGTVAYDHDQDGRNADLGGCQAAVRNVDYDTSVLVRYVKDTLTVITQDSLFSDSQIKESLSKNGMFS